MRKVMSYINQPRVNKQFLDISSVEKHQLRHQVITVWCQYYYITIQL